jgi:hypothetical protein
MTHLVLDNKITKLDDSENDHMDEDVLNNYRGYFANEDEPEERYFEHGAHFPYKLLVNKLNYLYKSLSPSRRETIEPKHEMFRKITDPKINKESRNNVIKKVITVSKCIRPHNVTENKTLLKTRNSKLDQAPIFKNTFFKKTSEKSSVNICTSFSIENLKKRKDRIMLEKNNPVLVLDKSYK